MSDDLTSQEMLSQITIGDRGKIEYTKLRLPKLVSISYTAVYDTGEVSIGAVVHNGSDEPLTVEFRNASGKASPLT